MSKIILGIDPGKTGGFVLLQESKLLNFAIMPLNSEGEPCFDGIRKILKDFNPDCIFLERAVSFGMGSKGAFNYGRGFAALEIATKLSGKSLTYVEPNKWTKEMFEGISKDLKTKVKSGIALERLFKSFVKRIPLKAGKAHEGIVDALLIAAYGQRKLEV